MIAAIVVAPLAGCASSDSARYVRFREIQANLNDRTTGALKAGLTDAAMAKRILTIGEAVTKEAAECRAALASGSPPHSTRAILDVIARLLSKAEILPDPELMP